MKMILKLKWTTTDRLSLVTMKENVAEYVNMVVNKLTDLAHSYLAKSQSSFLKLRKEEMNQETLIIMGDFAENYKFMVQDEVQGFHWNNLQCTLHPVVIYYHDSNEKVESKSYCIISDEMTHNTTFVYALQKKILKGVSTFLPHILHVEYYTDGCSGQYKNYKIFINLYNHEVDFQLKAEWNFFATSHGKQPCDGIGSTVKRITSKASLQRD